MIRARFKSYMVSRLVLGDSTIETLTPSVNTPLVFKQVLFSLACEQAFN
jgi:hypothetical protein